MTLVFPRFSLVTSRICTGAAVNQTAPKRRLTLSGACPVRVPTRRVATQPGSALVHILPLKPVVADAWALCGLVLERDAVVFDADVERSREVNDLCEPCRKVMWSAASDRWHEERASAAQRRSPGRRFGFAWLVARWRRTPRSTK